LRAFPIQFVVVSKPLRVLAGIGTIRRQWFREYQAIAHPLNLAKTGFGLPGTGQEGFTRDLN
jgi:hypothetical protein